MVIPLVQPDRRANSQGQAIQKGWTKGAAAKTEAELVQIGLQVIFWQTMIGTQNESFGVADHDVQPVQQTRVGIERVVRLPTLECSCGSHHCGLCSQQQTRAGQIF